MAQASRFDRPWLILVTEFATVTTMHGIRFLAEPSKFLGRRLNKRHILCADFSVQLLSAASRNPCVTPFVLYTKADGKPRCDKLVMVVGLTK